MTLAEQLHAERKARLVRLGAVPTKAVVSHLTEADIIPLKVKPAAIDVPSAESFWPSLWCWDLVTMPQRLPSFCKTIQSVVAAEFNISVLDMRSTRRTNNVTVPRWVAMYLCQQLLEWSLPQIGRHFGGKDHTTVLHGLKRVEAMMEMDFDFRNRVNSLMVRFA